MLTLLLAILAAAPAAAPKKPLQGLLQELEKKRCDEAFALVASIKLPEKPGADDLAGAQAIARAVPRCRAEPAVAFGLTQLAARPAPQDAQVQLEHARSLLAVDQQAEAATVLDLLLQKHPDDLPAARLLRGRLAAGEGEPELALRILAPLAATEAFRKEAEPIVAECRKALAEKAARPDAGLDMKVREAVAKLDRPAADSGRVVASFPETMARGEERGFVAKGLRQGERYLFRADGSCWREQKVVIDEYGTETTLKRHDDIFGLDFAVQFGRQDPRQLGVGQGKPDHNEISFLADGDSVAIRVFDRSHVDANVHCSLSGFAVVVP